MREDFARAMRLAEQSAIPVDRVNAVKRAVAAEMKVIDSSVDVRFTEYFNHSIVPDMVLHWRGESRERLLFVRPSDDPNWIRDDLEHLPSSKPVVFTLGDAMSEERTKSEWTDDASLDNEAQESGTWILDPAAVETFDQEPSSAPKGLLGQGLMRGGRGLHNSKAIGTLQSETRLGFAGAQVMDAKPLAGAVTAVERALQGEQAGRITRVLRAVWEGRGGQASAFPTVSHTGPLTDEDLSYLLHNLPEADSEFWERIGRGIDTGQLGRLKVDDPSLALQMLVEASLDNLQAKAVGVSQLPRRLDEIHETPRWLIDRNCLAIREDDYILRFAARKADELPEPETFSPPSLPELRARAAGSGAAVTRVDFGTGKHIMSFESRERFDVVSEDQLAAMVLDSGGARVEKVSAYVPAGGVINIDFAKGIAQGQTSTSMPVRNLAIVGTHLLLPSDEERTARMDAFLGMAKSTEPTGSLFEGADANDETPDASPGGT